MNITAASPWPLAAAVAFVSVVHIAWLFNGGANVFAGELVDGDSYMHLLRVERLLQTGMWFDAIIPDGNYPYGASLHWTRFFDIVLLAMAAPMAAIVGFSKAIFWAGVAFSPIIHILSVLALAWAVSPLLGRVGAVIAGALTAVQVAFMAFASVGHADHHLLYVLMVIITLGFALRSLVADDGAREAIATGAMLALGLWAELGMAVFMFIIVFVFGLAWLFAESKAVERNFFLALGLASALLAVMLVENGLSGFMVVQYDHISIIHLTMALLLLVFWGGVRVLPSCWQRLLPRIVAVAAAVLVSAIILTLLYPKIAAGGFGVFAPETMPYIKMVEEFDSMDNFPRFLLLCGSAFFAIPWVLWQAKRGWSGGNRWPWILLCLCVVFFTIFAVFWIRWSLSASLFLAISLAGVAVCVDGAISTRIAGFVRVPLKVTVMVLLLVGPSGVGAGAMIANESAKTVKSCPLQAMAKYLNGPPWVGRSLNILASANFGPELLYRTNHKVLASNHHRNVAGVIDSVKILGSADAAAAWTLAQKRQVGLLLLCPNSGNDGYFLWNKGERVLYRRLLAGDIPGWLKKIDLPVELRDQFRLFEIVR